MPLFLWSQAIVATVQDILNILTNIAADSLAESWDNVGLLLGSPLASVSSILIGLDPTSELLAQASRLNAEVIITHHPLIFHPLKALRTDQPAGKLISAAVQKNIHIIGCHTNLDSTVGGVSDVLAKALGVSNPQPLVPSQNCESACGLGRTGNLPTPMTADAFIANLKSALHPPWLLEAGSRPKHISRVAVCGGSCSDFAQTAFDDGADVFVTAEIKHSTARWAEEAGMWLIDAGHFATENPAMEALQQMLVKQIQKSKLRVQVHLASQEPPLKMITTL